MLKLSLFITFIVIQGCFAPPVTKNKASESKENENEVGLEDYMEYHRYLKEVVDALESDPQFREKLEKAEESDIRTGKIAHELEFVSHKVRSRLDEIKRVELERLRHLASKQYEIENDLNNSQGKVGIGGQKQKMEGDKQHIDHTNPHTFEIEDLKKLIAKSTQDLAEADRKRREGFKEYEMQKEFEKQEKLKSLDDIHRVELEKQIKEQEEKHKKHEPLHHPGSKQQLEEVWEKQDHMEQQDFDPKTFFMLHDLDGNGVWDENEVKTLFIKELDKMYSEGAPEDDMRERIEEMERMREHVFQEVDKNKDGLISYEEFLDQTKRQDFQEDKGWETLDQQKVYSEEEYRQYEKRRLEEVERLIAQGMLPPHPGAPYHAPGMQQPGQFPPQGHHPGQGYPQEQYHHGQMPPQYHHGQMPPQYQQGHVPQQQYPQGHVPQQQYPQGHVPQQQYPQGHVPQQQYQQGHVPQQQYPQGHVPQQQHPQGHVPQQQHPQGHAPQQQPPQGHVPQQQYPQEQLQQGPGQPPHSNQPMANQPLPNQVPAQGNQVGQGQLNTNEVYPQPGQTQQQPPSQPQTQQNQQPIQKQQPPQNSKEAPQVNQV